MTTLVQSIVSQYGKMWNYADPRTKDWFLLSGSPIYVWILTISYLAAIKFGKRWMKDRQAFSFKNFMVVYNLGLVGLSTYMLVELLLSTWDAKYDYVCAPYNEKTRADPKELRVAKVLWWYFFSKAIEMMDTMLMILRKKNNQITFLHVFHHASMLNIWWWVMTFIPGGLSYFGSGLNCLVHVIMYSYYGLSVFPLLKGKLWWKHYITRFQLIQFCITLSHTLYSIYARCDFPIWGQYLLASLMITMLVLFGNFYLHAYILKRQKKTDVGKMKNGHGPHDDASSHESNGHAVAVTQNGHCLTSNGDVAKATKKTD